MSYDITPDMIIEEYLNNWFTIDELAQYLCISVETVNVVFKSITDEKIVNKIKIHNELVYKYYTTDFNEVSYDEDLLLIKIANYIIENKTSIRATAQKFGISKSKLHESLYDELPYLNIFLFHDVFMVLMENKSCSIDNKFVVEQVLSCAELLINGLSSQEICKQLHIGRNVLQRNLTLRLKKINHDKYLQIKELLKDRQLENLTPFSKK